MPADKDGKVEEGVAEELVRAVEEAAAAVPSPEKKGATDVVDADAATTPPEAEPMKVPQSIWDATAVAPASHGDLRFMPSLLRSGARYCDVCGHEYCRSTYHWVISNMELAGIGDTDDDYNHHCNRSGSSWPPGEGPAYEPEVEYPDDYYYSMGCCKCEGLWGKTKTRVGRFKLGYENLYITKH